MFIVILDKYGSPSFKQRLPEEPWFHLQNAFGLERTICCKYSLSTVKITPQRVQISLGICTPEDRLTGSFLNVGYGDPLGRVNASLVQRFVVAEDSYSHYGKQWKSWSGKGGWGSNGGNFRCGWGWLLGALLFFLRGLRILIRRFLFIFFIHSFIVYL